MVEDTDADREAPLDVEPDRVKIEFVADGDLLIDGVPELVILIEALPL